MRIVDEKCATKHSHMIELFLSLILPVQSWFSSHFTPVSQASVRARETRKNQIRNTQNAFICELLHICYTKNDILSVMKTEWILRKMTFSSRFFFGNTFIDRHMIVARNIFNSMHHLRAFLNKKHGFLL